MSHIHDGPLATYNSLTDKNLSGYFSNSRMRKHLRKSGLVNRRGVIVSENQYRLNMARKEHKKHVKELLAQAIVHKTLDLERTRQVEIRRKLEEIAKIELVRRVRTTRGRKGDEEILPYLSPRPSRPSSRPATATEHRYRPRSAPSRDQYEGDTEIVYVDDRGRRLSPSPSHREVERPSKGRPEEIDTKHLYALDTTALRKYALHLSRIEQGEGSVSPYLQSPVPTPPRSARSSRTGTASLRIRQRPRTAETRDTSPYGDRKHGEVQGTLMLHRQEPAMMHQGEVQTLCEITMKYHGPNLTLPRDQHDPCQNINIDQQHCGGNTLPVFKEALKPGDTFSFVSRRHRGYPFSLSIFVDGRIDSRVSTCCEYRHAKGVKLGGKMGHFSLLKVTGATPCYKCKLISQATPRSLRRPPSTKSKGKPEELKEDVIVVDRKQIQDINDDDKYESDSFEESDGEDDKKAGRDEKRDKKSSSSSSSSKSSSRSSSRSSHSDSDEEKFDRNAVKHIVYEDKKKDNKRQIIGMQADGDRERESLRSKDTDSVTDVNVPGRKIDGYSDDEEYPDGPKYRSDEPYSMATKVTPEIEKPEERGRGLEPRKRDDSASSRSRSSSSSRSRSRSPVQEKRKSPSPVYDRRSPSPVYGKRSPSPVRSPSPKERKSPSPRSVSPVLRRSPSPERKRRGSVSSRSSTSSVHISDSEEEKELPKVKVEEIPKRRSSSSSSSSSSDDERRRKRKEEDVGRTPSPFPEAFSYTSYKEELSAKEKREEELRASPLPGPYRYQKMYEDSDNEITQTIEVQAEPLPEPASYQKLFETSEKETVASMSRDRKSSSSSSSGSVSSTGKGKVVTATIEPVKRASPVKSSSSSSSDSSSESEPEKKKPEPTKVTESPKKTEPVKSSSSSSSDSSTESEQGKKEAAQTRTAEPVKAAELPKTESAKKSASSSSDSSSFSSSSESDSEDENKKKTSDAAKPPLPKPPSPKLEVQTKETSQTEKKSAKSESDSSGSSDSSSDSDSDSEEDTDRKPKQGVTTPAPEVKETKVPTPPTEPKAPEKKQDSSDSSSGSESDTESSETETDRSKEAKVKSKEAVDGPRTQQLATVTTEHVEKKQTQSEQPARLQQEVKKDASDSDSDTSSSDSSDTEEENEKKIAGKGPAEGSGAAL